jgi:diadenosine tetraphosphate (Ap4A) HIT family hydrolase
MSFALHPRLAADSVEVGEAPLSQLRLFDDRRFPWLLLVPALPELREIHELSAADRGQLIEEVAAVSRVLVELVSPTKVNVGALGNLVPQLHVHVVARFEGDAAWPVPVWGSGERVPYAEAERERFVATLRAALAREPALGEFRA